MKFLKRTLLLLIILIFGCKENGSKVIISGNIKADTPYIVAFTTPINEAAYSPFKEKITPDSLGNFQIKLPLEKAAFVKLVITKEDGFQQITNTTLIVEPDKKYILNFDLNKKDKNEITSINGFNKLAQQELNKINNPIHIQVGARPFFKDSIASVIVSKVDSLRYIDISKFENLYKKDSISKAFFELLKLDRAYYYEALKGTIGFVKFLMNERTKGMFNSEIKTMWESCFENDLLTRSDFQNTEWGFAFAENYLYYKGYETVNFDFEKFNSRKYSSWITESINLVDTLLPKSRLEFYKAAFLFNNLIQKNYEKELVTVFNDFKKEFPSSSYTKYLNPMINEVIGFHEAIKEPFSEDIRFVKDYEGFNSFDEVLKSLKGEKLYVDFWATWCGPCKKEFKHSQELKKLLSKYNYKSLYVSIDREEKHQQWLDMVKFYNLHGTHLRANEVLSKEISEMGVNYIPRYFLVDEEGHIIENKAKNPSQLEALEKQLIQLNR
ncbi:TlpA family protein disulfide reductase [Flavivirga rizhaonensis]|uniref:TlpA family protein disulfide reductase n=1 Tax=Flavivirga rizhaonensis TaxID=2559571 RepID=A0A4S1DSI6_9FLAO|nr:TlpA disulfide reductase family protein [Flavivirga rizhaonensis]TGV00703.1 TlpA family protein disulfide reductase [Flavivirga rizhaonensis]